MKELHWCKNLPWHQDHNLNSNEGTFQSGGFKSGNLRNYQGEQSRFQGIGIAFWESVEIPSLHKPFELKFYAL